MIRLKEANDVNRNVDYKEKQTAISIEGREQIGIQRGR
jgi:hypothetical protein